MLLGKNAALESGAYKQIRLILAAQNPARVVEHDGSEAAVRVPSGSQSGLKVNYAFRVEASKETRLAIDFDLRKSLKKTGGGSQRYLLKPVLRIVDHSLSGQISGALFSDVELACAYSVGAAKDTTSECTTALTSALLVGGVFKTSLLPVGRYSLRMFRPNGAYFDIANEVRIVPGQVTVVAPE